MKEVDDLGIVGIRDPNTKEERVLFKAINSVSLEWYVLINTKLIREGGINILNDHVFWFPSGITVKEGEFIRVYTVKAGEYKKEQSKYGKEDAIFHDFFWGLRKPIWDMVTSDALTVLHIKKWNTAGSSQ